jgi:AcrR family transcriptional regulator
MPVLRERGARATTSELATACGVAEGTLFRAFADKRELLLEAVRVSLDPDPAVVAIDGISTDVDLMEQITEAAQILSKRMDDVVAMFTVLSSLPGDRRSDDIPAFVAESNVAIGSALERLFDRHRHELAVSPSLAAFGLRGLVHSSRHPLIGDNSIHVPDIVWMLLSGVEKQKGAVPA